MAMDLKHVIEKIKKEGVEEADRRKEEILQEAEKEAASIREEAERQKESIISAAKNESEKLKKNSEEAIRQAARDLILSLREEITALFDSVTKQRVSAELGPGALKDIIVAVAEKFVEAEGGAVAVLLSDEDHDRLSGELLASLKEKISEGVEIRTDKRLKHGFKIGLKDSHSFYDFSDEAISEAFFRLLNPMIRQLVQTGSSRDSE